jgi:hypothetical protein
MTPTSHQPSARRAVTALVAAAIAALSVTAAPALADDCPNAALRAQNNSTQLPDCRAYELVTPVFKEGFSPVPLGITDAGRLTFVANGSFANNGNGAAGLPGANTYLAERDGNGWVTEGLAPSGPEYHTDIYTPFTAAVSSDLRSSLWLMRRGDQTNAVSDLYIRRSDDTFTRIGSALDTLDFRGGRTHLASDDLSHIAFIVGDAAYEYFGIDHDHLQRVDVDNAGQPLTPVCGSPNMGSGFGSAHHAISTDGRVIFLGCSQVPAALFARVDGTTTISVSESQCTRTPSDPGGACNAHSQAMFQGASADGTRVYFTTTDQLVNGDTDDTSDLYECDIPTGTPAPVGSVNQCPALREVSGAVTGADVQGVTRLSENGSRAYFVAKGVLASNPDANGVSAMLGDDNLYVWTRDTGHPDGETRFVAKLDPADGGSPGNGLWNPDWAGRLAQATDDGRYLVFGSYAPLVDHGPQADTDSARDIYRYDAETDALTRLSIGVDGGGGNEPGADANFTVGAENTVTATKRAPRTVMSDDGGSVVFNTTDALAPGDTNGTVDVYLWHEGHVSLISSGKPSDDQAVQEFTNSTLGNTAGGLVVALISSSGRDVYFETTARLVSTDVDSVFDIYDARVDGGFDLSGSPACSGDACQSPPSVPPPPSQTGSTSSTGQAGPLQTTPAFTVGKLTARQLKRVVSTGKVLLSVTTNASGVLSAQATATFAQRPGTVGSAKRTVTKAGTLSLSLPLSKKARAELRSKHKLTVKVLVRQDNVAIARTVSLKLTQPKAASKKAKKKSSHTTSRHAAAKGGRS